ncbi:thioredoxin family protein [Solitalea sp. MAHUQ-68]|uniref:Thioredoxin family protein n=1 Tax=Solitalea agri TaxID=2953739 RepID=A0A9X2F402_9SPHI|nr:thioredoxin family protein [Solitalea agri]MCO4293886.1 thioredoxin family protein [Solitalea agri]
MDKQAFLKSEYEQSISYESYRELIDDLLPHNLTTGNNNSPDMIEYARMNVQRMNRWDKTYIPSAELSEILKNHHQKEIWLVLTEGWCGDAAQNVPLIKKIADLSPNIEVRFLLRDQHIELMDQYLTNGGQSIPKLIRVNAETFEEIGTWGPRPTVLQEQVLHMKNEMRMPKEEMALEIHLWYARNKGIALETEFMAMLNEAILA